ncbi:MAG: hypothetical protein ACRBN8_14770 [Nannocystales bacterium]
MTDRSLWKVQFVSLDALDVVEALFEGVYLADASDVGEWERRVRARLDEFGGKVDLLISLEGLRVKPAASRRFGESRAAVLADYAACSFRYGADPWTATSISTSSVIDGADENLFHTRAEALEALVQRRRA